jgi:hypothetical protein
VNGRRVWTCRLAWLRTLLTFAFLGLAPTAHASIERFAVLIGNNEGAPGEATLRYAEQDAEQMAEALKDVGGFAAQNVVLLNAASAPAVERALIATNDRIRATVGRGAEVVLFVYFSGHADGAALHLSATRLDLPMMEQLVRSSAAAFRVLVLDACRSGALTRVKGGAPAPPFLLQMNDQLDSQGAVFLTSSASHEDAQESDEIGGSFFTHYLRSGLLGAADEDGDGKVTLEEAYAYAYRWTLSTTSRTWAGTQHPTYRYDVRGRGGIVITEPRAHLASRGTVVFPGGRSYLVWHARAGGAVAGEVVNGAPARSLSLKPGRYFIRARAADHLLEGEVALAPGETVDVTDDRLHRIEYARLVRKGGPAKSAHGPLAGYAFHTALRNAESGCHGAFLAYPVAFSAIALVPRIDGCAASFANSYLDASIGELAASVEATYGYDLPIVSLHAGLSAGAMLLHQRFTSNGDAPPRTSVGAQIGLHAGATVDVTSGFYVFVQEAMKTYWFEVQNETGQATVQPSLAFQQSVGVGKYW